MDYKVILSDLFLADLREIVEYLKEHAGAERAERIGNDLLDRTLQAGQRPFLGRTVAERPNARKILRYPYLIYYDVNEPQKVVEVLRVWHGSRDPKTLKLI